MNIVVVAYDKSVDLSSIGVGAAVAVNGVAGGKVIALSNVIEEPATLVNHTHDLSAMGKTGPAVEV